MQQTKSVSNLCLLFAAPLYSYRVDITMGNTAMDEAIMVKLQDTYGSPILVFPGPHAADTQVFFPFLQNCSCQHFNIL